MAHQYAGLKHDLYWDKTGKNLKQNLGVNDSTSTTTRMR